MSSQPVQKLVHMAEQIAVNVTIATDQGERVSRLADHMQRFWDPRMRKSLASAAKTPDFSGSEVVRLAALRLDT